MAARKQPPQVVKVTGARRLVELGKDLLIALLTASAIYLAAQTPLATQLKGFVPTPAQPEPSAVAKSTDTVAPCAMAVRNDLGLYGVSYDDASVGRVFDRFSALLGEGLSTAGTPEVITRYQWLNLLGSPGVYCAFQEALPLTVLCHWLDGDTTLSGKGQALCLVWEEERVWLGWRSGSTYYRSATGVSYSDRLEAALGDYSPNGAAFAYTLAGTDDAYSALDPCVLVSMAAPQPVVYAAASPDFLSDQAARDKLLGALGFLSNTDGAYETVDGLTISENGDRLQLTAAGGVTFRAGEDDRYPAGGATAQEAAEAAWELLSRCTEPWRGEADYVLTGVEQQQEERWVVTFHARLGGVPVILSENGWSARFVIENGRISDFALVIRSYTPTEETTLLPTYRLAAAAMRSLPRSDGALTLRYRDNRGASLTAGWTTGE